MTGSEDDITPPPSVDLTAPAVVERHFEKQTEPVRAVPTPLGKWNRQCRDEGGGEGLAYGWHIGIGGATGKGKSLLAENIGATALRSAQPVGFVSFEMSKSQLATRLYAIATETPVRHLERGDSFSQRAAEKVSERLPELCRGGAGFHTNDRPLRDIHEAVDLMHYWREEHLVRLFIVDYLQLAAPRDAESEYQAVSYVSRLVRQFAVETDSVTIGLSQLNRSTSANRSESPIVEGLKSTSSLEQDSDQVLLLDHSRYERQRGPNTDKAKTFLLLAKNRHGATGEIPVEWDYRTLRIRQALPDEEGEWDRLGRAA